MRTAIRKPKRSGHFQTITVSFEKQHRNKKWYLIEFEVEVEFSIANSGIGAYEFWGAKCYDNGSDYPEISEVNPIDILSFKKWERRVIRQWLANDKNIESLQDKIEMPEPDEPDYPDSDER